MGAEPPPWRGDPAARGGREVPVRVSPGNLEALLGDGYVGREKLYFPIRGSGLGPSRNDQPLLDYTRGSLSPRGNGSIGRDLKIYVYMRRVGEWPPLGTTLR